MPILSTCLYLQNLLNGLVMPGAGTPAMVATIEVPDPNVETEIPTAYVWPTDGEESRDGPAGTMPRNTGPGTPSGDKSITHNADLWVVWMGYGDDPQTWPAWLGVMDAVMNALRTAYPMPVMAADPYTEAESQISDVGERQSYKTAVNAVADQAYLRFDALIRLRVVEVISA